MAAPAKYPSNPRSRSVADLITSHALVMMYGYKPNAIIEPSVLAVSLGQNWEHQLCYLQAVGYVRVRENRNERGEIVQQYVRTALEVPERARPDAQYRATELERCWPVTPIAPYCTVVRSEGLVAV